MFQSSCGKGFHMTFQNGFSVSVQWGVMNYCERRSYVPGDLTKEAYTIAGDISWNSKDAEVAVLDSKGKFVSFGSDDVLGWVSTDDVSRLISLVSAAKDREQLEKALFEFAGSVNK